MLKWIQKLAVLVTTSAAVLQLGCGKQEFVQTQFSAQLSAAGSRALPAKVDIVFLVDNTGSITPAFSTLQAEMSSFVSSLQSQFWDYHVARVLIANPFSINKVLVNGAFNQATLPDGTPNPSDELVPAQYAVTDPAQFNLLSLGEVGAATVTDPGYSSLVNTVKNARDNNVTNFFRKDALLAIVVVTNGVAKEVLQNPNSPTSLVDNTKLQTWANNIKALKTDVQGSDSLIRFYPVASPKLLTSGCFGGGANNGNSYFLMSNFFSGVSGNVCDSSSLTTVFDNIASDLTTVHEHFIYSYIVRSEEPNPDKIVITKNGVVVPRLPDFATTGDGWSYYKYQNDICTITGIRQSDGSTLPICSGVSSGYTVRLLGNAQLIGADTAQIEWKAPGQDN